MSPSGSSRSPVQNRPQFSRWRRKRSRGTWPALLDWPDRVVFSVNRSYCWHDSLSAFPKTTSNFLCTSTIVSDSTCATTGDSEAPRFGFRTHSSRLADNLLESTPTSARPKERRRERTCRCIEKFAFCILAWNCGSDSIPERMTSLTDVLPRSRKLDSIKVTRLADVSRSRDFWFISLTRRGRCAPECIVGTAPSRWEPPRVAGKSLLRVGELSTLLPSGIAVLTKYARVASGPVKPGLRSMADMARSPESRTTTVLPVLFCIHSGAARRDSARCFPSDPTVK
mmetsp:Transcript_63651/g.150660  ORF Transcript_63651/g.150660 Transcript_63651/m.150660 type:complete len:283 (-) Transcript_63651:230-1078(-)